MNMIPENERKLVETLKSLALEDSRLNVDTQRRAPSLKRILWVCVATLLFACGLCVVFRPTLLAEFGLEAPWHRLNAVWKRDGAEPAPAISQDRADTASGPKPPQRTTSAQSTLIPEITGSGYVIAPVSTEVFARSAGTIATLSVELGDAVKAGQELLRIDGITEKFTLEKAELAVPSAALELEARRIDEASARVELDRIARLIAHETVPAKQRDDARVALQQAENKVAQAQQALSQANVDVRSAQYEVDRLVVRAPFAGTVTQLAAHVGDMVLAQSRNEQKEESLMTITDISDMVIDADVAQNNISVVKSGVMGEAVLDAFPSNPFKIMLYSIAPMASVQKGTITLRFHPIDPPTGIRPNMAVRVRISGSEPATPSQGLQK
jgi:RND family efflux transporter MFP subunit